MKKIFKSFILLLAVVFLFTACQKKEVTCEELLISGLEYGINGYISNGYIFLKTDDKSSVFFMPDKTKSVMYSEKFIDALEATKDFAIYVSASVPYEIAIFECYSKNDIDTILRMCYERADEIKIALRSSDWNRQNAMIEIQAYKKYVISVFSDSTERNEGVIEVIKELLC